MTKYLVKEYLRLLTGLSIMVSGWIIRGMGLEL